MIILTGRFQPFHLGHVELINKLLSEYPDDIICLGIIRDCHISNDKDEFDEKADEQLNTTKNPYDSEILMILLTLYYLHSRVDLHLTM